MARRAHTVPQLLLFALVSGIVVLGMFYYPKMESIVAYHFDAGGTPDAWCGKTVLVVVNGGIALALAMLFVGLSRLLPRVPPDWIRIPGKEPWSSGDRKEGVVDLLMAMVLWIGVATQVFLVLMYQKIYSFNSATESEFGSVVLPFGALVVMVTAVVMYFNARLRKAK